MKYLILLFILVCSSVPIFSKPELYMNEEIGLKTDTIFPSEYEKYVSIYNIGNDDLVISAIYASCGCTTFTISKDTIPPNDSAALFVKINLSTASGDKQNHVYLTSNDT